MPSSRPRCAGSEERDVTPDLAFTRLSGGPAAERVLLVGPSLGTAVSALWGRCATLLGNRFEVIGWDLPGHGRSPAATYAFGIADLADAVRLRAIAVAKGRRSAYAGVSLGGAVAFQLATDPGPFGSLAAIASAPRIGDPAAWQERADLVRRAGTPVLVTPSATRWFAPGFIDREPEAAAALLTSLAEADRSSYAWACEALADFDAREQVPWASVRVRVALGEHDPVVPPRAGSRVLAGCGHLPPVEDPAAVATVLADFFVGQAVAP
jgi:pimeloyl-ACP methyl ester carboxylesterase